MAMNINWGIKRNPFASYGSYIYTVQAEARLGERVEQFGHPTFHPQGAYKSRNRMIEKGKEDRESNNDKI